MIYLDHAAATPVDERVFQAMRPYFGESFFNPSAPYLPAKKVRAEYETAKDEIAHTFGAKGVDLVMTAGATESINLAFLVMRSDEKKCVNGGPKCLILATEHDAVRNTAFQYNCETIMVDKNGLIDLNDLERKIDDTVMLVSVAMADSELGTIQPMAKIGEIIRKVRMTRAEKNCKTPIFLHSDASQAMSLVDINVSRMGIDLLTINSGKIYGPKGVGALYVAHGVKLMPVAFGGGQERGLRSGTENVAGVVGFAAAAKLAKEHINSARKKYAEFVKIFLENFRPSKTDFKVLGNSKNRLANFLPISINGIDAERLIFLLEDEGILISTGAACAASKGVRSRVLTEIGMSDAEIEGSVRITFGQTNNTDDVKKAAIKMAEIVDAEILRKEKEAEFYA